MQSFSCCSSSSLRLGGTEHDTLVSREPGFRPGDDVVAKRRSRPFPGDRSTYSTGVDRVTKLEYSAATKKGTRKCTGGGGTCNYIGTPRQLAAHRRIHLRSNDASRRRAKQTRKKRAAASTTTGRARTTTGQHDRARWVSLEETCPVCNVRIKNKARLKRHLSRVHPDPRDRVPASALSTQLLAVQVRVGGLWHAGRETEPWQAVTLCGRRGKVGSDLHERDVECLICNRAM
jgi:hypothetical protein